MSLAFLKYRGTAGEDAEFEADIGTSRFYQVRIGERVGRRNGLELVEGVVYETPLAAGPPFNVWGSGFTLAIPAGRFSPQTPYAQLVSFADQNRRSPAVSRVVSVSSAPGGDDLIAMASVFEVRNMKSCPRSMTDRPRLCTRCRAVDFTFREARPGRSPEVRQAARSFVIAAGYDAPPFAARSGASLTLEKVNPVTMGGESRFVYTGRRPIRLQAYLALGMGAPRGVPARAIVDLEIADQATGKPLLSKSYRLKDVAASPAQSLEIPAAEAGGLPRGVPLAVSAAFRYLGGGGLPRTGTGDTHTLYVVDDYFYGGVGSQIGTAVPLADRARYRAFWNKIWDSGAAPQQRWTLDMETRYYIRYRPREATNGRVETRVRQVRPGESSGRVRAIKGTMKSGLEVCADTLNDLIPSVSDHAPLGPSWLDALKSDGVCADYDAEATARLKLKGRADESGAIWAYPEVALFELTLGRVAGVDQNGQVTALEEETVAFPRPVSIHFVGEKTKGDGPDGVLPGESRQAFDVDVALKPVELAPIDDAGGW